MIGIAVCLDIAIVLRGEVDMWHKQVLFAIAAIGGIYAFMATDKKKSPDL